MDRLNSIDWTAQSPTAKARAAERNETISAQREASLRSVAETVTALIRIGENEFAERIAKRQGYEITEDGGVELEF